jgi:hypothetical protein
LRFAFPISLLLIVAFLTDEILKVMKRFRVLFLVNKDLERRPLLIRTFQSLENLLNNTRILSFVII